MANILSTLADYEGLLDNKQPLTDKEYYVTFEFFGQDGKELMKSRPHPISYEDIGTKRRFPKKGDDTRFAVQCSADGTCNKVTVSLYTTSSDTFCGSDTLECGVINLAQGNSITFETTAEGLLNVDRSG